CASSTDAADVWVDGVRPVGRPRPAARSVAHGRLVDHDLAALVEASHPLTADLITRAGLQRFSGRGGASRLPRPGGGAGGGAAADPRRGGTVSRGPPPRR
ncbi:MAG: hypothetical protein ACJ745_00815, partial [Actinomycetes bacterium]